MYTQNDIHLCSPWLSLLQGIYCDNGTALTGVCAVKKHH